LKGEKFYVKEKRREEITKEEDIEMVNRQKL
jgi:hypothetical protein